MRKSEDCRAWVVYRRTLPRQAVGSVAICEQDEWDDMELASPGHHTLIREGITNEAEAEKLARIQPGVTPEPKIRIQNRV